MRKKMEEIDNSKLSSAMVAETVDKMHKLHDISDLTRLFEGMIGDKL